MTPERFSKLKRVLQRRQHDLTVLADRVHKQQNVSAIIRTCDAVGVARLHIVSSGGDFRRYHMAAGGSKRWVEIEQHESAAAACRAFRAKNMQILAAHAGPDSVDYREPDYTRPTAIVVYNELQGPTPQTLAEADATISIPMHGLVESLNVSVAAALVLFEAERQRAAAGFYERPTPDTEAFANTLFEWAHPTIAERCRRLGLPYPPLDESGELTRNPFEAS